LGTLRWLIVLVGGPIFSFIGTRVMYNAKSHCMELNY
jgi:hypothetical protein